MTRPAESAEVREALAHALQIDLIGPWAGHSLAGERLPGWVRPSNWYLTGFLVPRGAPVEQRGDADVDDEPEVTEQAGLGDIAPETRSVSLFLVNDRNPSPDRERDEAFAFQAELEVRSEVPFVPRPDPREVSGDDWDERVADLHYAGTPEYAAGHGVSADRELARI